MSIKGEQSADIYLTGDTEYYEGIAEVANRYKPAYVFIFAGAAQTRGPFNVTMGTNDTVDTALAFPDVTIIPLHYEGGSVTRKARKTHGTRIRSSASRSD